MGLGTDYCLTKKALANRKGFYLTKLFTKSYIFLRTVCSAFTKRASAPIPPT